ncbi:MAG: cytidine deaminase [Acidobacteriota bacterium]
MSEELIQAARQARQRAVAPYSKFRVGAALETEEGVIFTGCNIENSSYGLTMCAERVALFKAVSEGHLRFKRLCVVAQSNKLAAPCGACRQVIWDLCGDIPVLLVNLKGEQLNVSSAELLPYPFDRSSLEG